MFSYSWFCFSDDFCGTTSNVDAVWLSLISQYMAFIWLSIITLWQWHQISQILFCAWDSVWARATVAFLWSLDQCCMANGISVWVRRWAVMQHLANVFFSSAAWCQRHPALLWDPDCRWVCAAWHGPSGDGALPRLAGSWNDEGLVKQRWMPCIGCIDRVQGRQFQLLDTNWKLRFSFSIQFVLAPVCCYWYCR